MTLHTPETRAAFREAVRLQLDLWRGFCKIEAAAGGAFHNLDTVVANAAAYPDAITDGVIDRCLKTLEAVEDASPLGERSDV